jgi:hypothetical protein
MKWTSRLNRSKFDTTTHFLRLLGKLGVAIQPQFHRIIDMLVSMFGTLETALASVAR